MSSVTDKAYINASGGCVYSFFKMAFCELLDINNYIKIMADDKIVKIDGYHRQVRDLPHVQTIHAVCNLNLSNEEIDIVIKIEDVNPYKPYAYTIMYKNEKITLISNDDGSVQFDGFNKVQGFYKFKVATLSYLKSVYGENVSEMQAPVIEITINEFKPKRKLELDCVSYEEEKEESNKCVGMLQKTETFKNYNVVNGDLGRIVGRIEIHFNLSSVIKPS
uniref:ADOR54 n=1 Tax=Adoxophyes orana granulovirus TaxID=170617 RepID=A0A0A7UY81_GVAO|nr:ADOR54 [Adoxophyes orana granulovirus]